MASLSEVDDGRRIYFKSANGSRQILYVSKMTKKQAEGVLRCVSDLERCRVDGSIPSPSTMMWLGDISPELHGKLAKHGLCQPRVAPTPEPAVVVVTLADLIERFRARPKWDNLAESTRVSSNKSFVILQAHFGGDRDIASILETDAEDMVDALAPQYAEATIAKITGAASMIMRYAVKSCALISNPFAEVRRGSYISPHRAYVEAATCDAIIKAAPTLELKLIVALSRFAGLRTPSEHRVLKWSGVDWERCRFECDSPKTGPRVIPIVPETMELLEQQFEAVPDGTEFVLPGMVGEGDSVYGQRLTRIVKRLGLEQWPRVMHSLRASRQTDWNEVFPAHVTAAWMGNSAVIADKHYNRTLDAHFEAATNPTRNPTQAVTAKTPHDASA